ncbi:MAG: F0F1 ATP synthase subunit A [Parvularculaceae bacterium]
MMNFRAPSFQAAGPLEQFEISPIIPLSLGDIDVSFTNSALWMLIGVAATAVFFFFATRGRALVPGRVQSMAEVFYEFVFDLVRDIIGQEGRKFFPYVFTLFIWILIANLFGLIPTLPGAPHELHTFTPTSHVSVTLTLAFFTIFIVIVYGFWKNGWKFLKLFAPSGIPWPMYVILVPIEIISFISRPFTLAIRLFANMFAGHILLKLFAGFIISLLGAASAMKLIALIPGFGIVAITMLELLVAVLQAYVFAVLTCIYLSDAESPEHH